MLDVQVQKKLRSVGGELWLDLAFSLQLGERLAIVGASGSGKTTLLRMIAGLLTPDAGKIVWQNEAWFDRTQKINQPPQKRQVGLMFQDYALFPNMTIRQNLEYALQKGQAKSSVADLIAITELEALAARLPQTLSGGQQQRVALARALVARPPLLLLDEPLSALDAPLREKLQDYILKLQEKYQLTTIWVTHNAEEVNKIANRVLLLEHGKLLEQPLKTKPTELTGTIQSIEQQADQQLVTIALPAKEKLLVGNKIGIRPKD